MKKTIQILSALIAVLWASSTFALSINRADAGEFIVVDPNTRQPTNVKIELKEVKKWWEVNVANDGVNWHTLACQKGNCNFTNTSRKTLQRLFAAHPNQELVQQFVNRKIDTECVDAEEFAFCRFIVKNQDGKDQTSYGWRQVRDGQTEYYDLIKVQ